MMGGRGRPRGDVGRGGYNQGVGGHQYAQGPQAMQGQQMAHHMSAAPIGTVTDKEGDLRRLLGSFDTDASGDGSYNVFPSQESAYSYDWQMQDTDQYTSSYAQAQGNMEADESGYSSYHQPEQYLTSSYDAFSRQGTIGSYQSDNTNSRTQEQHYAAMPSSLSSYGAASSSMSSSSAPGVIAEEKYRGYDEGSNAYSSPNIRSFTSAETEDYTYHTGISSSRSGNSTDYTPRGNYSTQSDPSGITQRLDKVNDLDSNHSLDTHMLEKMESLQSDETYSLMLEHRQKLQIYAMRYTIIDTIKANQVVVVSGDPGCGKSTQVVQFILDDFIQQGNGSKCRIVSTQPRRINVVAVAERVAAERCETLGDHMTVGYHIKNDVRRARNDGSILFCTGGILLKYLEMDRTLNRASHVILDEIQDRDLQTDFLMIILKDLLSIRKDLKVILLSTPANAQSFSEYFDQCPLVEIPVRSFPVREFHLEEIMDLIQYQDYPEEKEWTPYPKKDDELVKEHKYKTWCAKQFASKNQYLMQMLQNFDYNSINLGLFQSLIRHIWKNSSKGTILIFVSDVDEIDRLAFSLNQNFRYIKRAYVVPLYASMNSISESLVFSRPPHGKRKIIIATDVAESSITIDDVVYVIDTGRVKAKSVTPQMNLSGLEKQWISKESAKLRASRASRVTAGYCYHLYTTFHDEHMVQESMPPEMLRTRLSELCVKVKHLGVGPIIPFLSKAMQPPDMDAVQRTIDQLTALSALDKDGELLPLGFHLAWLPMDPQIGKMVLFGALFSCLDPILTVAASLYYRDPFNFPEGKEEYFGHVKKALALGTKSDHIMIMNLYEGWEQSEYRGPQQVQMFTRNNFLSPAILMHIRGMKKELAELLCQIGFIQTKDPKDRDANLNSGTESMLRAILCAGLYPNVGQLYHIHKKQDGARKRFLALKLKDDSQALMHYKSVNGDEQFFETKWMIFYKKHSPKQSQSHLHYVHETTMASPLPLLFFGGSITAVRQTHDSGEVALVDNWMQLNVPSGTTKLVENLRAKLDEVLKFKISTPGPTDWNPTSNEGSIMMAISKLITMEPTGEMATEGSISNW